MQFLSMFVENLGIVRGIVEFCKFVCPIHVILYHNKLQLLVMRPVFRGGKWVGMDSVNRLS